MTKWPGTLNQCVCVCHVQQICIYIHMHDHILIYAYVHIHIVYKYIYICIHVLLYHVQYIPKLSPLFLSFVNRSLHKPSHRKIIPGILESPKEWHPQTNGLRQCLFFITGDYRCYHIYIIYTISILVLHCFITSWVTKLPDIPDEEHLPSGQRYPQYQIEAENTGPQAVICQLGICQNQLTTKFNKNYIAIFS